MHVQRMPLAIPLQSPAFKDESPFQGQNNKIKPEPTNNIQRLASIPFKETKETKAQKKKTHI